MNLIQVKGWPRGNKQEVYVCHHLGLQNAQPCAHDQAFLFGRASISRPKWPIYPEVRYRTKKKSISRSSSSFAISKVSDFLEAISLHILCGLTILGVLVRCFSKELHREQVALDAGLVVVEEGKLFSPQYISPRKN